MALPACKLSTNAQRTRDYTEHVKKRELPGQLGHGELFWIIKERVLLCEPL